MRRSPRQVLGSKAAWHGRGIKVQAGSGRGEGSGKAQEVAGKEQEKEDCQEAVWLVGTCPYLAPALTSCRWWRVTSPTRYTPWVLAGAVRDCSTTPVTVIPVAFCR